MKARELGRHRLTNLHVTSSRCSTAAQVVAALEARGIARDKITGAMVKQVLEGSVDPNVVDSVAITRGE